MQHQRGDEKLQQTPDRPGPPWHRRKDGPPWDAGKVVFVTSDKNEGTFIKIELWVLDNICIAVDKLLFLFQGEA